jgi:hypothetical protein
MAAGVAIVIGEVAAHAVAHFGAVIGQLLQSGMGTTRSATA